MPFKKYWNSVKKVSPNIGALYILSKIIFGIGIGTLLTNYFNLSNTLGIIIIIMGILLMMPAELKIIPSMQNK